MNNTELIVFIIYFLFMIGIGIYFFLKSKGNNEKDYFLGGRHMGPWVSALSAGASDMTLISSDLGVQSPDLIILQIIRLIVVISLFPQLIHLIVSVVA